MPRADSFIESSLTTAGQATEIPVTGRDLRDALDALIAGRALSSEQRPSIGCNIKWK